MRCRWSALYEDMKHDPVDVGYFPTPELTGSLASVGRRCAACGNPSHAAALRYGPRNKSPSARRSKYVIRRCAIWCAARRGGAKLRASDSVTQRIVQRAAQPRRRAAMACAIACSRFCWRVRRFSARGASGVRFCEGTSPPGAGEVARRRSVHAAGPLFLMSASPFFRLPARFRHHRPQ